MMRAYAARVRAVCVRARQKGPPADLSSNQGYVCELCVLCVCVYARSRVSLGRVRMAVDGGRRCGRLGVADSDEWVLQYVVVVRSVAAARARERERDERERKRERERERQRERETESQRARETEKGAAVGGGGTNCGGGAVDGVCMCVRVCCV
jgi:hypothetical protein